MQAAKPSSPQSRSAACIHELVSLQRPLLPRPSCLSCEPGEVITRVNGAKPVRCETCLALYLAHGMFPALSSSLFPLHPSASSPVGPEWLLEEEPEALGNQVTSDSIPAHHTNPSILEAHRGRGGIVQAHHYSIRNIQPPTLAATPRNRARNPHITRMTSGKPRGLVSYGYL